MSRSGYSDDCDGPALALWRGAVNSAIKGARGQKLLRELVEAMDAMTSKRLVSEELVTVEGEFCALGVVGCHRGIVEKIKSLDPDDRERVATTFDIAPALAAEIVYMNDEASPYWKSEETPEQRWTRMREWAQSNIKKA